MAFAVNFYQFAKKENSTKIPTAPGTAGATHNCVIKDGSSITAPVLGIHVPMVSTLYRCNYAYIATYNRYYYITDWKWDSGLWWATLICDTLATYKTAILNTNAYIVRAMALWDGTIADTLTPATTKSTGWVSGWGGTNNSPWEYRFSNGFYVVGIINNDASSIGAVSYYAFTPVQFAGLKSFLLGDTTWTGITTTNPDLGDSLYKSLFNPFQYISSINWFPLAFNTAWGTALTSLKFGWWTLDEISCYRLTTYIHTIGGTLYVGEHPQAATMGVYLNAHPFSTYRLLAPPFGEFTLDSSLIVNSTYTQSDTTKVAPIVVAIQVDFISGNGSLRVWTGIGNGEIATLVYTQTEVAVPIQLAQITTNGWGQVRNIVETGAGVLGNALSLDVKGAVSSAITGVLNGIELKIPHAQEKGNNGSIGIYTQPFQIENVYATMANDIYLDRGKPLCRFMRIGDLATGYCQTVGAHVEIDGTDQEIAQIDALLDGGIYLE